jgi:hypothetical protein
MAATIQTALGPRRTIKDLMEAVEAKVDVLVSIGMDKGVGRKAPPTPPAFDDDDIKDLAERLGSPDAHQWLPSGAQVSLSTRLYDDDDYKTVATSVSVGGLVWTIEELLRLGLWRNDRWQHHRFEAIVNAIPGRVDRWIRPHEAASIPNGRPPRW